MKVRRLVAKDLAALTTMAVEFEKFLGGIEGKRRRVEWTLWNINAAVIGFYVGLGTKLIDDELILDLQLAK